MEDKSQMETPEWWRDQARIKQKIGFEMGEAAAIKRVQNFVEQYDMGEIDWHTLLVSIRKMG